MEDRKIIDGKSISRAIREEIRERVDALSARGIRPGLAVVLVGDDPASRIYVSSKEKACEKSGIHSVTEHLPEDVTEEALVERIIHYNESDDFHGILVQLPLPKQIRPERIIETISPLKDVDGFHPVNLGRLMRGSPRFIPCTPCGIHELLSRSRIAVEGSHVVIVGRSNIVGKPLANILLQKKSGANATVTVCHRGSGNLSRFTRQADILVVAAGTPGCVSGDMVKEGVVIIDVGVNRVEDPSKKRGYRLVGDVDFESCYGKASKITPVPGGVGPMTITKLLSNTVKAAEMQETGQYDP
jgi:methylenetetrahydrofolate dehydrogenase (NADP+)/methenyltetrahydrofolate cyclohydrolase